MTESEKTLEKATILKNMNKYKDAIIFYKKVLLTNSQSFDALKGLADCYINLKEYENAIVMYKKTIEIEPKYPGLYYLLGRVYEFTGDFKSATVEFAKAIGLNADDNLVKTERKLAFSVIKLQEKIKENPNNIENYIELGRVFIEKTLKTFAYDIFKKAAELEPNNLIVLTHLVELMLAKREYKNAIDVLKHKLTIQTKSVLDKELLGDCYDKLREYDNAITIWIELQKFYTMRRDSNKVRIISDKLRISKRKKEDI